MNKSLLVALCAFTLCPVALSQTKTPIFTPLSTDDLPLLEEDSARIDLSTPKSKYVGGESIKLDIALRNTGTKGFRFFPTDAQAFYEIEVIGPYDKKATRLAAFSNRGYSGETWGVAPGGSRTVRAWVSNLFDMTMEGKYKITVSKKFHLGKEIITVKSAPLLVEVTSYPTTSEWQ